MANTRLPNEIRMHTLVQFVLALVAIFAPIDGTVSPAFEIR